MKKITLALIATLLFVLTLTAQSPEKLKAEKYLSTQGELTFTFHLDDASQLEELTQNMSLVHFDPSTGTVKAWANRNQFRATESPDLNLGFFIFRCV
jgi:hypothetical protein